MRKEIGFGISIVISIVLVLGGIVNGILLGTIPTALVVSLVVFAISGIIVIGLTALFAYDYEPGEMSVCLVLFSGALGMFIGSGIVAPPRPNGLVIIKDGDSQRVVDSTTFVVPYRVKVDYISDLEVTSIARLSLDDDNKEVQWDVKAKLKLIAKKEKAFNLVKRFGGKDAWLSEIQKIFDQAVNDYLTAFKPDQELPSNFKIELKPEQKEALSQLGYEVEGDIFADSVRIKLKEVRKVQ